MFIIRLLKSHPLLRIINSVFIDLPIPQSLFYWWNFGSLAAVRLAIQLTSGLFLSIHYCGDVQLAFQRVVHVSQDVNLGWLLRFIHANGASLFFVVLYAHVGRGLYYSSFSSHMTWSVGVRILFLVIGTSFLGYVLPWGQMSFWGATVITNLASAMPYVGERLVVWLWGGFSVSNATLTRFFSLHFLLPFVIAALAAIHLVFLHLETSRNPLGLSTNIEKISFHPYFVIKDLFGAILLLAGFFGVVLGAPLILGDCENFIPANPLVTPVHIQPEWYFLFAYAILRSIPNKLGGVIALVASIAVLYLLPLMQHGKFKGYNFYPLNQVALWALVAVFMLLTWIGMCVVEDPYLTVGQRLGVLYFAYFLVTSWAQQVWDRIIS